MKIGVMGTGMVGDAIASKLVALGHEVMIGSRESNNPKAVAWAKRLGERAQAGSFEDTARFGELVFNCTNGGNSLEALRAAGEKNLSGKILNRRLRRPRIPQCQEEPAKMDEDALQTFSGRTRPHLHRLPTQRHPAGLWREQRDDRVAERSSRGGAFGRRRRRCILCPSQATSAATLALTMHTVSPGNWRLS